MRIFGAVVLACLMYSTPSSAQDPLPPLSWQVVSIEDGAELLTLFFRQPEVADIPLISVVRDTLGSRDRDVHRLRYVWVHTYTSPSLTQRIAASIPFLYSRLGNASGAGGRTPKDVMDLSAPNSPLWSRVGGAVLKSVPYFPRPLLLESSTQTYGNNQSRYRETQIERASTVLALYEPSDAQEQVLSVDEIQELQARLAQTQNPLGPLLNSVQLERLYQKELSAMRLAGAGNWELLRQRAEAESLFFEPLLLPDGTATHALLWVAREDLQQNARRRFGRRFLNISSPWDDKALLSWKGVVERRYYDADNRPVPDGTTGSRLVELIPLALYGLDHPKIPALLVDFRAPLNAKRRELSAHARDLIIDTLLPVSPLTFLGRFALEMVTRRKGADLFQPSRFRSYSQLKTLLALDTALDPQMRSEIGRRLENVAVNPLENDLKTELQLARNQYNSLLAYALRPDGLRVRIERDRRAELTKAAHSVPEKAMFQIAHIATLGLYTHRESDVPQITQILETQRRSANHSQFLTDVIKSGPDIEINWDTEKVRRSLGYLAANGVSPREIANKASALFARTQDQELRILCLDTILGLEPSIAQGALRRVLQDKTLDRQGRTLTDGYLALLLQMQPLERPLRVSRESSGGN